MRRSDGPSSDDIAENFHYAGAEVIDFVQRRFDVVGDLTLGEGITSLKWRGRTFLEGLESQSKKGYTWGEMVTAVYTSRSSGGVGKGERQLTHNLRGGKERRPRI